METTSQKTTRRNYRAQFKESFATVVLLMKEEWAALEDDALAELDGDLEQAVALLATHLESTKAAARRHIVELVDLAVSQEAHRERSNGAAPPRAKRRAPSCPRSTTCSRRCTAWRRSRSKRRSGSRKSFLKPKPTPRRACGEPS